MTEKKKILVILSSDLYTRNFVISGAMDELRKGFDLSFAIAENCDRAKLNNGWIDMPVQAFGYPKQRDKEFYEFTELDMVRLRRRCSTFDIKYRYQLPRKKQILFSLLSLPVVYPFYKNAFMRRMGEQAGIAKILDGQKPDMVIIPTSLIESISIDVVNSCKKRGIKTLMLINGWDNVSSKGTIPNMPDYLGVWGEQSKEHAARIHNMPPQRIVTLGVPHFKEYYQRPTQSREDFRRSAGLPLEKKVILFAGSCRVFDETSILLDLEKAIADGELGDIHILYRPHPWRHKRQEEDSFFDHAFAHVTMDPDAEEAYRAHKSDPQFVNLPNNVLPDIGRYVNLYNAMDAVICTLTTIIIEAAITGLPVLAVAFSDQKHRLTMDKIIDNKHFEGLDRIDGITVCRDRMRFLDDCRALIQITENRELCRRLKTAVNYIAFHDEKTYAQRLRDAVETIVHARQVAYA